MRVQILIASPVRQKLRFFGGIGANVDVDSRPFIWLLFTFSKLFFHRLMMIIFSLNVFVFYTLVKRVEHFWSSRPGAHCFT